MWSWLLGLRKCFGTTREGTPEAEAPPDTLSPTGNTLTAPDDKAEIPRTPVKEVSGVLSLPTKAAGTASSTRKSELLEDLKEPTPPKPLVAEPSEILAASKPNSLEERPTEQPGLGSEIQASPEETDLPPPVSSTASDTLLRPKNPPPILSPKQKSGQRSYSAQHLNSERIAKVTRSTQALSKPYKGTSRLQAAENASPNTKATNSVSQQRNSIGSRARAIKKDTNSLSNNVQVGAHTGRLGRIPAQTELQADMSNSRGRLSTQTSATSSRFQQVPRANAARPNSAVPRHKLPEWTAPVLLQERDGGKKARHDTAGSSIEETGRSPTIAAMSEAGAAAGHLPSPQTSGKENAQQDTETLAQKGEEKGIAAAIETSQQESRERKPLLKPEIRILLPEYESLSGTSIATPSPAPLRFMMTTDSGFGTPNVVGIENLPTQYREDKRLRVHETPFEERVERFIEKERIWKEARLSTQGSEGLV